MWGYDTPDAEPSPIRGMVMLLASVKVGIGDDADEPSLLSVFGRILVEEWSLEWQTRRLWEMVNMSSSSWADMIMVDWQRLAARDCSNRLQCAAR
mmetsp:Transcript_24835/g.44674  ORF Transcript_24835/g.44674 Transcript_24835/m.44674 type:complete len:95 (-) Transcript_24835:7-291(-)